MSFYTQGNDNSGYLQTLVNPSNSAQPVASSTSSTVPAIPPQTNNTLYPQPMATTTHIPQIPTPAAPSTSTSASTTWKQITDIFNKSNMVLLIWFLILYYIVYWLVGRFNSTETPFRTVFILDSLVFLTIFMYLVTHWFALSSDSKQNVIHTNWNAFLQYLNDPTSIISILLFLIVFYSLIYLLQLPMDSENKSIMISLVENIAILLLVVSAIFDFFNFILKIPVVSWFDSFWKTVPDAPTINATQDLSGATIATTPNSEVFNISNNLYTFDDAQAICKSYGASLATYDQIEQAYQDGAEWCNYGWSDGQMAYFPTQKKTWEMLQKNKTHKNDCGRPGINGGYMANPNLKFGVNCFGVKPKATDAEMNAMKNRQNQVFPKNQDEILLDKKVNFWKENADKLLVMNSFNQNKWSEY